MTTCKDAGITQSTQADLVAALQLCQGAHCAGIRNPRPSANRPLWKMYQHIAVIALGGIALIGRSAVAQQAAPPRTQAILPQQGMFARSGPKSPEINPDGSLTFRLSAPSAFAVTLSGDWQDSGARPLVMTKGDDGVWQLAVTGLKSELRTYSFIVDGVRILDQGNPNVMRDGSRFLSALMVPGDGTSLLRVADVPHGMLQQVWYPSPTLGMAQRHLYVYTPSGYQSTTRRYPVLYLLHGGGGDEDAWTTMGRAIEIMDNLIAAGKAEPMIVVMPNGNWNQTAAPGITEQAMADIPNATTPGGAAALGASQMKFVPSVVSDLLPFIDRNYRTLADANHRAIAGLSMGGAQSALVGLTHLDQFAYVGLFSAGLPLLPGALKIVPPPVGGRLRGPGIGQELNLTAIADDFPDLNSKAAGKLRLLYIACGEEDGLITSNRQFMGWLGSKGIPYQKMLLPGYSHEWPFWRISLADIVPKLFR